jgi:hypothetical protein
VVAAYHPCQPAEEQRHRPANAIGQRHPLGVQVQPIGRN